MVRDEAKQLKVKYERTRPDTRPSVADGWAEAEVRVFPIFDWIITDQRTDRRTDRRTDKASYRVACPQLKSQVLQAGCISSHKQWLTVARYVRLLAWLIPLTRSIAYCFSTLTLLNPLQYS